MSRYVCVHGHFYQPPRENPWLEEVELEDSAYPHHDWNERITAECYAPNAASRILDGEHRIQRIVNNYASMSFNFGPTLLSWLERHAEEVYAKILDADRQSAGRCSGHGNALAQAYSHMILPLAHPRDVRTQVLWGVEDFRHRFGRDPEGMWLPETAVDTASLEALADVGVRFTILAPHQAVRVRPLEGGAWVSVEGERVDPTMPYAVNLPSGRSVAVFFYDGPISRGVAFEGLLRSGERFAERVLGAFSERHGRPQLVHAATDGETYGHHHRHGDMALAYALHVLATTGVRVTNYGEYLERHPPTHEVEVREGSSWSCAHGVERWRDDCGCQSGAHPEWNQGWRAPLRQALDALRASLDNGYEEGLRGLLPDPWEARDAYIHAVLDRDRASVGAFLARFARRELSGDETVRALKLLEMQRHAMLMYTSCGWFFDDISGLETVQVLRYAGRAVQLAQELFGDGMQARLEAMLAQARSNVPGEGDGRTVYRRRVLPAMVDLAKVGAHHAVQSVLQEGDDPPAIGAYRVEQSARRRWSSGGATLEVGRVEVSSEITRESSRLCYGVLYMGGHSLSAGVRSCAGDEVLDDLERSLGEPFQRADFPEALRMLDRHFEGRTYGFRSLFRDARRRLARTVLASTLETLEHAFEGLYRQHAPLMQFLVDSRIPLPKALKAVGEVALEAQVRDVLRAEEQKLQHVGEVVEQARNLGLDLDEAGLAYVMEGALDNMATRVARHPQDASAVEQFEELASTALQRGLAVDVHHAQNVCYAILEAWYGQQVEAAANGDSAAERWVEASRALAEVLRVRVPERPAPTGSP